MADKQITFEKLGDDSILRKPMMRAKVPGGWLVVYNGASITFIVDPKYEWDGSALPG